MEKKMETTTVYWGNIRVIFRVGGPYTENCSIGVYFGTMLEPPIHANEGFRVQGQSFRVPRV